jgi:hypothetical protein
VTSGVDDNGELKGNGGHEPSISVPDAHVETAPSAPIRLQPPTEAESPL